ncbi:YgiQ family radical SAM protein [Desulfobotulus mexicanus]|uniref:YgiQ family radical SAM protein n=1 Tax=Desulfobotulus mexicanus TaxID=2586642 RepID=A0A5Q4VI33_9BACT|nr:YgiQ family radical SAM protein [Desulfobotulus mexicanus]TYT75651.1 YgiQ family radical SAM protein [Desulfobotulus mexicanus]
MPDLSDIFPTSPEAMARNGWDAPDIILVTGDAFIDAPSMGIAVIARVLAADGFRVAILAQPDPEKASDFTKLGEPRLFWGVSAGSVDSMVANYTASKKRRKNDDYTPGGVNDRRPDRACIVYTNRIRRYFKNTVPILLGGIEASLRRISHYDFWDNKIRRSILFDAKADYLLYGMAESSIIAFARSLKHKESPDAIPGLCLVAKEVPENYLTLPSFEEVSKDKKSFLSMFHTFYENNDPITARGLAQAHADRFLIQNPPFPHTEEKELDAMHALPFTRSLHPDDASKGEVRALETIRHSITTHYGCYGECNFCAIAVHQGRRVRSRSLASIVKEAESLTHRSDFKGIISDAGGPTANMYGFECRKKLEKGSCTDRRCLFPEVCPSLKPDHSLQKKLLKELRSLKGVRKVFVASGVRYDLLLADKKAGPGYLEELVSHHVSGQMKVAPEHICPHVLSRMGKPGTETLERFRDLFFTQTRKAGKPQFLTYYFIAAHPGCTEEDMKKLGAYARDTLKLTPEQVQIFTPTPSTWSAAMYWTETDPWTGEKLFVEKDGGRKKRQKDLVVQSSSKGEKQLDQAMRSRKKSTKSSPSTPQKSQKGPSIHKKKGPDR